MLQNVTLGFMGIGGQYTNYLLVDLPGLDVGFSSANAAVIPDYASTGYVLTNHVGIFNSNFFTSPDAGTVLLEEALHYSLQMSDSSLSILFGTGAVSAGDTSAISTALKGHGCK